MTSRRALVSGNWKMHHDHLQAIRTIQDLGMRLVAADLSLLDVSVHPPFTDLRSVQTVVEDRSIPLFLGAQHCYSEDKGAFTGEVSPAMLARLGVGYVIVGHSERRLLFRQSDEQVAATLRAVLRHEMVPIVCVGETEEERKEGLTRTRVEAQLEAALKGLPPGDVKRCVIAYEPIWAIGTGNTASAEDAQDACAFVREVVGKLAGDLAAAELRIQYGGSVRPDNAAELMTQADVDGLLVGGASLDAPGFAAVVSAAASARRRGDKGGR